MRGLLQTVRSSSGFGKKLSSMDKNSLRICSTIAPGPRGSQSWDLSIWKAIEEKFGSSQSGKETMMWPIPTLRPTHVSIGWSCLVTRQGSNLLIGSE